jgi:hypothetical protein
MVVRVVPPAQVLKVPSIIDSTLRVLPLVGPPGVPGPQGPAGASGDRYIHNQTSASASWTIEHDLSTRPFIIVFLDDDPQMIIPDPHYIDLNTASIAFDSPVTGKAYC